MRIHMNVRINLLSISALMMVLLLCCSSAVQAAQEGDYTYNVENGEAIITGYTGTGGDVTIPGTLGGVPVTSIDTSAFYNRDSITSINLPESLTSIGTESFLGCHGLTNISIPKGVTSIGDYAFADCTSLVGIRIPKGVIRINYGTFYGCSGLTSISIPEGVTDINNWAFDGCVELTSVSIPEGVTSIGDEAFNGCSSLTSITLPESVTSIYGGAFSCCTSLTSILVDSNNSRYTSVGGVLFNKDKTTLIIWPGGLTSISIPKGITSIGNKAFYGCVGLTSISIPEGVISIGNGVFRGCTNLASITLPESVTNIGDYVFWNCTSLTSISIPKGVTIIGEDAFKYCTNLVSIKFNSATTYIYNFKSTIPETTTIIGHDPSTAKDYAAKYNRTFQVIGDLESPIVRSTDPVDNATNVPVNKVITITFNENILYNNYGLNPTVRGSDGSYVDFDKGIHENVFTIDPIINLNYNTTYTVTIPAGLFKDASGNILEEIVLNFTTTELYKSTEVFAFGNNNCGQLGLGHQQVFVTPTPVEGIADAIAISTANNNYVGTHSMILTQDGRVYSFGANSQGQLGMGDRVERKAPTMIEQIEGAIAIAAGGTHSLIMTKEGRVFSFGDNNSGQLGLGDQTNRLIPTQIEGVDNAIGIAAGNTHSFIITQEGYVYAFGDNSDYQLGLGDDYHSRYVPTKMEGIDEAIAVSTGISHTLVLTRRGRVYSCGNNYFGQLGLNDRDYRTTPTLISSLQNVTGITVGEGHSLIMTEGQVYSFGNNYYGQLGVDSLQDSYSPKQIEGIANIISIAAGRNHSLILTAEGQVYSFGANGAGQLGLGDAGSGTNRYVPTIIENIDNVVQIAAGGSCSLLICETATPEPLLVISSIKPNPNIRVGLGTPLSSIILYKDVTVTLNDGSSITVPITWDKGNPQYNDSTPGSYIFSGIVTLPAGISNPNNLQAYLKVIVGEISVFLNNNPITFRISPYIKNNLLMVPMRDIFQLFGLTIFWDDQTKTALATDGATSLAFTVGRSVASVNGNAVWLDLCPEIQQNCTFVPIRFACEAMGFQVEWDAKTRIASIISIPNLPLKIIQVLIPHKILQDDDFSILVKSSGMPSEIKLEIPQLNITQILENISGFFWLSNDLLASASGQISYRITATDINDSFYKEGVFLITPKPDILSISVDKSRGKPGDFFMFVAEVNSANEVIMEVEGLVSGKMRKNNTDGKWYLKKRISECGGANNLPITIYADDVVEELCLDLIVSE